MNYNDYDKALEIVVSWHHARAMASLKASHDLDLTEDEYVELWGDYELHTKIERNLYDAAMVAAKSFLGN
jgi:hypothetical protein